MEAIVFDNVSKIFPGGEVAAENVSVRIRKGEFVFVIGRSGAGKSTFLKLAGAQEEATSGKIWVNGQDLSALTRHEIPYFRRQIGVMQPEFGLLKDRTLFDNVNLAMLATEQPRKAGKKRVMQMLKLMGIEKRAGFYPREVSMGEAARALLARAIICGPSILLADEPTANLDPDTSWDMMCLMDELNRQGMTVVVASHNRELVTIMRKRVLTFSAGCLVADEKNAVYNARAADAMEERRVLNERMNRKRETQ
ncbi:MAG TPA: ATP-binding cassette domain-containing protein [Candidatus Mediterraneibacter norfolkensis]|nr:ATP-binding cassette domain-containing protein [Candidatus Mediterraneibacter norfolkensis]